MTDSNKIEILRSECLELMKRLPDEALPELLRGLERAKEFYFDRCSQPNLPVNPPNFIKGRLNPSQVRPPIVLED
jgi:hypothetical protein